MCACESAGEQIDPRVLYLGKATICWRRGCRETEEMEVMRTRRNETRRQAGDEQDVGTSRGPELLRVPRHLYILFYLLLGPLAIYIEPTSSSLFVAIYLPELYVHSEVGRKLITSHHTTLHKYQPFRLDYI